MVLGENRQHMVADGGTILGGLAVLLYISFPAGCFVSQTIHSGGEERVQGEASVEQAVAKQT